MKLFTHILPFRIFIFLQISSKFHVSLAALSLSLQEYVPKKLEAAHAVMGSREFQLAVLNCSQAVASGEQIFDNFKLQREWRPVVFATAPWVAGAVQLPPAKLKSKGGLHAAKYLSSALYPREKKINNDKEFQDVCGADIAAASGGRTCILALKGSLFSDMQQDTLSALVRTFQEPSTQIVSVSATKRWLSIDSSILSRKFTMRLYIIRNGTHHTSLGAHTTTDNAVGFVRRAIQASYP